MQDRDKIIITCGTFDPFTPDDLSYLKRCSTKGNMLVVGVHSDYYLSYNRGGPYFMYNYEARRELVKSLKFVDEVFTFNDSDGTVCQLLKLVKYCYPNAEITYISQEDMHNMPETKIRGITFETMK
jgi:cytidyltransferase-like protein